ncbi:hypothetical protein CLAIMM_09841 isoform 2 [Cladophialophora immunda]|nr:hypothetical protein CLAIMM_09841 isoform 1 [Cladophialophora immunda]OQV05043.1 hypothetical protein CLAIMM_09841 isoform 2 [Cladophialophora immunda]
MTRAPAKAARQPSFREGPRRMRFSVQRLGECRETGSQGRSSVEIPSRCMHSDDSGQGGNNWGCAIYDTWTFLRESNLKTVDEDVRDRTSKIVDVQNVYQIAMLCREGLFENAGQGYLKVHEHSNAPETSIQGPTRRSPSSSAREMVHTGWKQMR